MMFPEFGVPRSRGVGWVTLAISRVTVPSQVAAMLHVVNDVTARSVAAAEDVLESNPVGSNPVGSNHIAGIGVPAQSGWLRDRFRHCRRGTSADCRRLQRAGTVTPPCADDFARVWMPERPR